MYGSGTNYQQIFVLLLTMIIRVKATEGCDKHAIIFKDVLNGLITDGSTNYKSSQRCKWLIMNPSFEENPYISLRFDEKVLECSFDYVVILISDENKTEVLATLSGNSETSSPFVYARAQYMLIYLFSDRNYELSGFSATFHIYSCPNNCSGNGDCIQNRCHCLHAWGGEDCSEPLCPNSCSGVGSCLYASTKKCACSKDYIGAGCQLAWNGVALHNTWVVVNNYSNSNYFSTHLVGHSGSFVAPHLWIFGGYNLNRVYNHLLRYDFSSNTWFVVETARQPSPRYFHTMSHVSEYSNNYYLLVFGGEDENRQLNNELWIFDISNSSWTLLESNISYPTATSQHAATVVPDGNETFLYIFGGKNSERADIWLSSTMYRFRWTRRSWEAVISHTGGVSQTRLRRAGHSMIYDSLSNCLVVFGGYELSKEKGDLQRSHTLLIFDLKQFFWTEIKHSTPLTTSNMPKPMAFHSANIVGDYMVILGGSTHTHDADETCHDDTMYFYHLRCNKWSEKPLSSSQLHPSGRFAHVAVVAHDNILIVHGGYNGIVLNDVWAYKVPFFATKSIPNVCSYHPDLDSCVEDRRCGWGYNFGCLPANHSYASSKPNCPGLCEDINICAACSTMTSYQLDENNDWKKVACYWCVNEVSCLNSDQSGKCNDLIDETINGNSFWWNSDSNQLLNSTSQCIESNPPPGFLVAFYINDEELLSPNKVVLFHDDFSIDGNDVPLASGSHVIVVEGFLRLPSQSSRIVLSLQTKNGYGRLFLSHSDDALGATLRLENSGNLALDDKDPELILDRNVLTGNRLYYKVTMSYTQEHDSPSWVGFLKLSWIINNGVTLTPINPLYLEPFRSTEPAHICSTYTTCLNCMLDYSCAWCMGSNRCLSRNEILQSQTTICGRTNGGSGAAQGHYYSGVILEPEFCPMCHSRQNCTACLSDDLCGWNNTAGCKERSYYGGNEITNSSSCSIPCSARSGCAECLVDDGANECAWCSSVKRCFNFNYYHLINTFGQCILWTRNTSDCQNCNAADSCTDCVSNFLCGWCGSNSSPFQGSCVPGNLLGPEIMSECPTEDTSLPRGNSYNWIYGHCDVNECEMEWPNGTKLHSCSANASCSDTLQSYTCNCNRGFAGDGFACEPTCYKNCSHGRCRGPPSFQCECDIGWVGDRFSQDSDCDIDCQCNFHSSCSLGIGVCDFCNHNTTGNYCEFCLPNHYRNVLEKRGCLPCRCNGHGDIDLGFCDTNTGICHCRNNTTGSNCEKCLPGYYGDPRNGGICFQKCDGRFLVLDKPNGAFGTFGIQPRKRYFDNIFCIYIISSSNNDLIILNISKDLYINCSLTRLLVYDGFPSSKNTSSLLAAICGSDLEKDVVLYSTTGTLSVSYDSEFVDNSGFSATYELLSCNTCQWRSSLKHCSDCQDKKHCLREVCRCNSNYTFLDCNQNDHVSSGAIVWQFENTGQIRDNLSLLADEINGSTPGPLFGHSFVARGNELWLFGGNSYKVLSADLWRYGTSSKLWSRISVSSGFTPQARYLHAALVYGDKMLIFGGMAQNGSTLNDFWEFQFESRTWRQVETNINLPGIAGHTLSATTGRLFLIGGYSVTNGFNQILNRIWSCDLPEYQWNRIALHKESEFGGIYGHSASYHNLLVYVYGGLEGPNATPNTQMYAYDTIDVRWRIVLPAYPSQMPLFHPPFRYFHSSAPYQNGNTTGFLIFGGKTLEDHYASDVWLFRFGCKMWTRLNNPVLPNQNGLKLGIFSAVSALFNEEKYTYFVYGGNLYGEIRGSFRKYAVDSLCKVATTRCECAAMLAGCALISTRSVQQEFCVSGSGSNSPNLGVPTPHCFEYDVLPHRRDQSNQLCKITLDSGNNVCGNYVQFRRRDYCTCILSHLQIQLTPICKYGIDCSGCRNLLLHSRRFKTCTPDRSCFGRNEFLISDLSCSSNNCTFCHSFNNCHDCLRASACGWVNVNEENGLGSCLDGNLQGPTSIDSEMVNRSWNFLSCPPENECLNGNHKCNISIKFEHTICQDLEDGYECICEPKYELSPTDNLTCIPLCNPPCVHGRCKDPDVCECNFGFWGSQCNHTCNCNGHSECTITDDNVEICTNCLNNTIGDQCQHCQKNFVGIPSRNGGRCEPCRAVCNSHSDFCEWDFGSHVFATDTSVTDYGPTNRSVAVCRLCFGNYEGRYCEFCKDGYFEFDGSCHKCSCNGHDDVCNRKTGICNCKNNTDTFPMRDCHRENRKSEVLNCLADQCNHCESPAYLGSPLNGGICYFKLTDGTSDCIHGLSHLSRLDCSSPLIPGRTSFFVLQRKFINIDLRLVIDISFGLVDVFISDEENFFKIYTGPRTGNQEVTWKNGFTNSPANEPIRSPTKTKRETLSDFPNPKVIKKRAKRATSPEVRSITFDGPYQIDFIRKNEALWIKGVHSRLMIIGSSFHHQMNTTKFYVIFQARHASIPSSMTSSVDDVTGGAVGKIIFRQDLTSINFFVFSTVIFSCFCLVLLVFVILWKIKNTVNTQQAIIAHHMQLQHMASRPFSSIYLSFNYDMPRIMNQSRTRKKKSGNVAIERRSSDSSWVNEHRIPLLHTPGDFFTVVAAEGHSRVSPDLQPPDILIPETSSGKTVVVPKFKYQFSLPSKSDSWRSQNPPLSRASSTPSLSKQPSCSHIHAPSRSAPAAVCSSHRSKKSWKQIQSNFEHFNVGPIALERTGDFQAAVATFMLQLPGVDRLPSSMCLGSALVSTRHMNLTLSRDDTLFSKRKKFTTTKFL